MRYTAVLVALLVVLAGCSGLSGSDGDAGPATENTTDPGATNTPTPSDGGGTTTSDDGDAQEGVHPPDPAEDRLGWENGYWYNETIDVDRSDGLNDSELDKVVARSMARVEHIRKLEFEEDVPVEIISREEYRSGGSGYTPSTADRLHQNTKWEAMFMVNESTDAIATQQSNRGATVGGFYSPTEDRIVIVSENTSSPKLDEITLSQELFHALQDQKWNLLNYYGDTTEANNAYNGIIEGDGNYVDYLYEQRCEAEWDCLLPPESGGGGGGDINFGLYFVAFQPYSNGPAFVQQLYQEGGWEAVNEVYENPPASSEQVIHPDKYPSDQPSEVTVDHSPSNGWEVLDMGQGSIDYAVFGEAGIASMIYYPTFEATQNSGALTAVTVPYRSFFNLDDQGNIADINPYTYDFEASSGWDGDKLYPYVNDSSAATNETGYVWKLKWDSTADAQEFVSAYETILKHHEAERVDGHPGTWRIAEGNEFADAFYVVQDGDTVVIVNAPSVDALDDVREGAGTEA
jgi:hypothetical protein